MELYSARLQFDIIWAKQVAYADNYQFHFLVWDPLHKNLLRTFLNVIYAILCTDLLKEFVPVATSTVDDVEPLP